MAAGHRPLSAPAESFIGALDDVVIWRPLASSEVAAWYAATQK